MNKLLIPTGIAISLALVAGPAPAQAQTECKVETRNTQVNRAIGDIGSASKEKSPDRRQRRLDNAHKNLMEAAQGGQADDPAVWYFLGLYYALSDDPVGADSVFDRVEAMKPECVSDIEVYRVSLWAASVNAGVDSMRNRNYDGAKSEFRKANAAYLKRNKALFYLAAIFAGEGQNDSALYYFKHVADIGTADTLGLAEYARSVRTVALLHRARQEWDSTLVWLLNARETNASDPNILMELAGAYERTGDQERAMMTYDSVLAAADELDPDSLFKTGAKMFVAGELEKAVRAFGTGLEKNPYQRDALFNLASIYQLMADDPQADRDRTAKELEGVAVRLTEVDPANRESLGLLAAAYEMREKAGDQSTVQQRIDALTVEVSVENVVAYGDGYGLDGILSNLTAQQVEYPAITFEFLDIKGKVVTTQVVSGGELALDAQKPFSLVADGNGIVAWRYKIGS